MRLVVDSNIVFAGLLRDGATRGLLIDPPFEMASPEWMVHEIGRHRATIVDRAGFSTEEFDLLFALLIEGIDIVPSSSYAALLPEATARLAGKDAGDVPFLALALAQPCDGTWTQNVRHFDGGGVAVWTTARVLEWAHSGGRV